MKAVLCTFIFVATFAILLFLYLRHQVSQHEQKLDRLARKCARTVREVDVPYIVQQMPEFQLLLAESTNHGGLAQQASRFVTTDQLSAVSALTYRQMDVLQTIQQQQSEFASQLEKVQHELQRNSLTTSQLQQMEQDRQSQTHKSERFAGVVPQFSSDDSKRKTQTPTPVHMHMTPIKLPAFHFASDVAKWEKQRPLTLDQTSVEVVA